MRPPKYTSLPDRFWAKVDEPDSNDCWNWNSANSHGGYGAFGWKGKIVRAPRLSVIDSEGSIPDHLLVLHRCDNPPCVNPKHLYLGTAQNNSSDMVRRGRSKKGNAGVVGENHGMAILSEVNVLDIRKRYSTGGYSQRGLAREFGVARSTIVGVIKRRNWKRLK